MENGKRNTLPKRNPHMPIEKYIIPTSLNPIAAKVFESIIIEWIDGKKLIINNVVELAEHQQHSTFSWKWLISSMNRLPIWIHMSALLC